MNTFALGAASGAASLIVAVPLLAQFAGAASSSAHNTRSMRPIPTQACVQALADMDGQFLAEIDSVVAAQKAATKAHQIALVTAAGISDDATRDAAIRKAHEEMRTAMKTVFDAKKNTEKHEALKAVCGDAMMEFGPHSGMPMGRGPGQKGRGFGGPGGEKLLSELGLTADELKAQLTSGKTIEEIAAEKGITLPERPQHRMKKFMQNNRGETLHQ